MPFNRYMLVEKSEMRVITIIYMLGGYKHGNDNDEEDSCCTRRP